jgi:hypothetical protein
VKPTPEQITAMEARGWTWLPERGRFRADSANASSGPTRYVIGASVYVFDGAWIASYGWTGVSFDGMDPHPSPLEAADEAEAWLRGVLGGFRFPWLAVSPVGAKGCHGCANSIGRYCDALFAGRPNREPVRAWSNVHLEDDAMTPKPGAPECPGRVSKEQG